MYCHADSQGFCQRCGKLLPFANQDSLCGRSKPHGIGSHLKIILRRFGLHAGVGCGCNAAAKKMNAWTPDEAEARKAEILAVMRDEANRRGLPFSETIATLIVRRAIANARKEAQRVKGTS